MFPSLIFSYVSLCFFVTELSKQSSTTSDEEVTEVDVTSSPVRETEEKSHDEKEHSPAADSDSGSKLSQARLSSLEMLSRVFPHKKRSVLELVLQRCGDDLLKAIEHFVAAGEAVARRTSVKDGSTGGNALQQYLSTYNNTSGKQDEVGAAAAALSTAREGDSPKSAFTPVSVSEAPPAHQNLPFAVSFSHLLPRPTFPPPDLLSATPNVFGRVDPINDMGPPSLMTPTFGSTIVPPFLTPAMYLPAASLSEHMLLHPYRSPAACLPGCSECRTTQRVDDQAFTRVEASEKQADMRKKN